MSSNLPSSEKSFTELDESKIIRNVLINLELNVMKKYICDAHDFAPETLSVLADSGLVYTSLDALRQHLEVTAHASYLRHIDKNFPDNMRPFVIVNYPLIFKRNFEINQLKIALLPKSETKLEYDQYFLVVSSDKLHA